MKSFWKVVANCLVDFHNFKDKQAKKAVMNYRKNLKNSLTKSSFELVYHEEPFALANDIAGVQLDIAKYRKIYLSILNHHSY